MPSENKPPSLTRRERQIMDVLYRLERATAAEIQDSMAEQPHYSTLRAQLRVLEEKGHVRHEEDGARYVYVPTLPRTVARKSALRHVIDTFFDGSTEQVVAALLGGEAKRLTAEELDRLSRTIAEAQERNRP